MSSESEMPNVHAELPRIELSDGGAWILGARGMQRFDFDGEGKASHPYASIGHVYASERILLVGTEEALITLREDDLARGVAHQVQSRAHHRT